MDDRSASHEEAVRISGVLLLGTSFSGFLQATNAHQQSPFD